MSSTYRLYNDKALETFQQILFNREFDISLKKITTVMESPSLDRNRILRMQREKLCATWLAASERIEMTCNRGVLHDSLQMLCNTHQILRRKRINKKEQSQ